MVRLGRDNSAHVSLPCSALVSVLAAADQPRVQLDVELQLGGSILRSRVQVVCHTIDGEAARILVALRAVSVEVDNLLRCIARHENGKQDSASKSAPPSESETESYVRAVRKIQDRIAEFPEAMLFRAVSRTERGRIIELRQSIHCRLTQLLEVLAGWARGNWTQASRARLADITYSAMYSKTNRKRRMDKRVAENALRLREDARQLELLEVDQKAMDGVSEHSGTLYACILTLCEWTELAKDKDILGVGLAVARPEWVVDDPSQIRIFDASGTTLFARSAFEDAVQAGIDLRGHEKTTGGFGIVNKRSNIALAVRGRAREPINAWLPLFIHPAHWAIVRPQLRQIVGYFVTLDPLGYARSQVDAIFLVLSTMISRLVHPAGEHQLFILFQLMRTCRAVSEELGYTSLMVERIKQFIGTCHYETKDLDNQAKNILVIVGYLFVLPPREVRTLLSGRHRFSFWLAMLATAVRRSSFSIFAKSTNHQAFTVVHQIVHCAGPERLTPMDAEAALRAEEVALRAQPVPPDGQFPTPEVYLGVDGVKRYAGSCSEDEWEEELVYDASTVDAQMLKTIARLCYLVDFQGYPRLCELTSCLAGFVAWERICSAAGEDADPLLELDRHWGIAPADWIATTNQRLNKQQQAGLASEGSSRSWLPQVPKGPSPL